MIDLELDLARSQDEVAVLEPQLFVSRPQGWPRPGRRRGGWTAGLHAMKDGDDGGSVGVEKRGVL